MNELLKLQAYEQIRQLKYRYERALDTHDLDLMREVFHPDAKVWFNNGLYSHAGIEEIIAFYRRLMSPGYLSSHMVAHPEIELTGETTATAIWRVEDTVHYMHPLPKVGSRQDGETLHGAAYYYDEYVQEDGAWKIMNSGYMRIFEHREQRSQREVQLIIDPNRGVKR